VNAGHPIVRGPRAWRSWDLAAGRRFARPRRAAGPSLRPARGGGADGPRHPLDGGSEWVREGLRKPWVIDRYMFVNGVRWRGRARAADDPFALDDLGRRGVLATSPWAAVPAAYRPGEAAFEGLPVAERAALEAEAGREVFKLECTACHTERAHLGSSGSFGEERRRDHGDPRRDGEAGDGGRRARLVVRPGRPRRHLARPPHAALRRHRAEKRALAIHLARLGATRARAWRPRPRAGRGRRLRGALRTLPRSGFPVADHGSPAGRAAGDFYEMIGRLPQVREEMPPFAGSEDERRALAQYLGGLAATVPEEQP